MDMIKSEIQNKTIDECKDSCFMSKTCKGFDFKKESNKCALINDDYENTEDSEDMDFYKCT